MNQIRAIQALNKREIENGVPPEASWHTDYRDTAFVNFGGLPYELTEGDVITIFSQYGEPVFLKLARDKETGKSKGFGWLKYEDQRSCDLAVDNLGGAEIAGRLIRVDHARYKARDDEDPAEFAVGWADIQRKEKAARGEAVDTEDEAGEDPEDAEETRRRPMIKEEMELQKLIEEHDDDDPMKNFLIEEKKKEVDEALRKEKDRKDKKYRKHRHHHHSSHSHHRHGSDRRSRRDESGDRRDRRARRDATPVAEEDRDRTTRRKDRSKERDRERRRRDDDDGGDADRRRDGASRRDRGDKDRDRDRRDNSVDRRTKRYEDEDRDRDRDGNRKRRRRSRTRSP